MSYDAVEAALLIVMQKLPAYNDDNCSRGDTRILAKGNEKNIIFFPGNIQSRVVVATPRRMATTWEIIIHFYFQYPGDPADAMQGIRDGRQEILDHLDRFPTIEGAPGVTQMMVTSGQDPEIGVGEGRNWWRQTFSCLVTEISTVPMEVGADI